MPGEGGSPCEAFSSMCYRKWWLTRIKQIPDLGRKAICKVFHRALLVITWGDKYSWQSLGLIFIYEDFHPKVVNAMSTVIGFAQVSGSKHHHHQVLHLCCDFLGRLARRSWRSMKKSTTPWGSSRPNRKTPLSALRFVLQPWLHRLVPITSFTESFQKFQFYCFKTTFQTEFANDNNSCSAPKQLPRFPVLSSVSQRVLLDKATPVSYVSLWRQEVRNSSFRKYLDWWVVYAFMGLGDLFWRLAHEKLSFPFDSFFMFITDLFPSYSGRIGGCKKLTWGWNRKMMTWLMSWSLARLHCGRTWIM